MCLSRGMIITTAVNGLSTSSAVDGYWTGIWVAIRTALPLRDLWAALLLFVGAFSGDEHQQWAKWRKASWKVFFILIFCLIADEIIEKRLPGNLGGGNEKDEGWRKTGRGEQTYLTKYQYLLSLPSMWKSHWRARWSRLRKCEPIVWS